MPAQSTRLSFLLKIAVTAALVTAFDWLFPNNVEGVSVGLFALAWLLGLILARRDVRQARVDVAATLACAALCCVSLAFDPGILAKTLFWAALSLTALLPYRAGFDDAWRWLVRLGLHGATGFAKPLIDVARLATMRPRGRKLSLRSLAAILGLPLAGTAVFAALFTAANPVISDILLRIQFPPLSEVLEWIGVTLLVWPALRPQRFITRINLPEPRIALPSASLLSVLIALAMFNALFGLQNGLDIAFLWSGAGLPAGMSMTEYVHRGAYPLIVTALLAGLFALTMLRPGTATANNRTARWLVALWVGQNIFLVASSALRTIRYVLEFELTAWRIAALLWMGLVGCGLLLICWRIWFAKSARWLINANALAATLVLIPCCFVDLDAIAAQWNVRHAAEVGGGGQKIDLCYLRSMGEPALLPLIELERHRIPADLHDRVLAVRSDLLGQLGINQSHWWSWTPHGAMRLAQAWGQLGPKPPRPPALPNGSYYSCNGSITTPALTDTPAQ